MKKYLIFIFISFHVFCHANQDKKTKILIASPVKRKPEILKEFLESLKKLDKESYIVDYFFIDHNNVEKSQKLLEDFKKDTN